MAVIFPRWTNRIPLAIGIVAPIVVCVLLGAIWYWFSPSYTDVGYKPDQPVPFSHKLHAGTLGIDCRYCHNTVEQAAVAAIPPTATCMGCHSAVKTQSRVLEPIRRSYYDKIPIYQPEANNAQKAADVGWVRVHMLPDYAYFDHSVHVSAGVGCKECHGRVDSMEVVEQWTPLSMSWCLECHRDPAPRLRPRQEVTNMSWENAGYDATAPIGDDEQPAGGCESNWDCPRGYCAQAADGTNSCVMREVAPPENCSGCHR